MALLEGAIHTLGTRPGNPLLKPVPQSAAQAKPGELLLHVTARYLQKKGDDYVLTQDHSGGWAAIPGEDWISLDREHWSKLVPEGRAAPGTSWEVDRGVTQSILRYFYPPTENNDGTKDRIEEASLRATVESVQKGTARARITGTLKLHHSFYHREDGKVAGAGIVGFLEFETGGARRVRSLELVTDTASYGDAGAAGQPYRVALRTAAAP